ncbi:MAG: RNA 2',3'-cyclic phosphodiesterase [Actinomycetota bacterium]
MRLFVGVPVTDAVRDETVRVTNELAPVIPRARWVPPENVHITIAFLGGVEDPEPVFDAVDTAASAVPPMSLTLTGTGCFPNPKRARVLWIGLGGDADALGVLAQEVRTVFAPLGVPTESRRFSAHVTIARLPEPGPVPDPLPVQVAPVHFESTELVVYRSRLGGPAPVYEALHRSVLATRSV